MFYGTTEKEEDGRVMVNRVRQEGFTLIEAMIAMAVIAVAIFAVMSMTMTSMSTKESTRELQTAKEAVSAKIEEFKAKGFTALSTAYPTSPNAYTLNFNVKELTHYLTSNPGAAMRVTIDASNPDVYDILASIEWKGRNGRGTYTMRSLCAR
jgi:prepilin-type N-terminal cleavage/methylation domain-containing protein